MALGNPVRFKDTWTERLRTARGWAETERVVRKDRAKRVQEAAAIIAKVPQERSQGHKP